MNNKRTIASIKRYRTARLASLATKAYYLNRRHKKSEMYNLIFDEFVSLGGVYIKFLQGVLLRSEAIRYWNSPERLKVFENVESEPLNITKVLQSELPPNKLAHIALVQPQPFAAGSFGQVYYAQLADGRPVIIKVLRPMIRELLKHDLRLLNAFSKNFVLKYMVKNMDVDASQALKEFRDATLRETDYIEEAHFAHELYEAYINHPTYVIPYTYLELCTPNIIVQEYVDGISVSQLLRYKEQGVDPKSYIKETLGSDLDVQLQLIGFEALRGIFELPRIMGDPHPGNIRLLPQNKVAMIDFGISAKTPEDKSAFFGLLREYSKIYNGQQNVSSMFEQFIRFFVTDLYNALKKLSVILAGNADTSFTQSVGNLAQETFSRAIGSDNIRPMIEDGSIIKVVNRVVNKQNRFGLVMKLESSEILRAAQTYMTLVEALDRRIEVFPKVFGLIVEEMPKSHPELLHDDTDTTSLADALDTITNWLERVADRDPALFRQLMERIRLNDMNGKAEGLAEKAASQSAEKEKVND